MLAVEIAQIVARLHQFDKAQGNRVGFDICQRIGQRGFGMLAQQQGVDFDLETRGKNAVHIAQNVEAFVFARDFAEGFGMEAVDADVDFVQPGSAVGGKQLVQTVGIGGERDVFDFGLGAAGGNNIGQVATQRGFAACQAHFARAALSKGGNQSFDFGQRKLVRRCLALIAVRQAVGTAVIAQVGYGQAQIAEAAVEGIGKRGHGVRSLILFSARSGSPAA